MIEADDEDAWTFDLLGYRIFCADDRKLAIYDARNDNAWISAESACDLHEWA